jgi:hypothetical protein
MGRSSLELGVVGEFVLWVGEVPWSITALSRVRDRRWHDERISDERDSLPGNTAWMKQLLQVEAGGGSVLVEVASTPRQGGDRSDQAQRVIAMLGRRAVLQAPSKQLRHSTV